MGYNGKSSFIQESDIMDEVEAYGAHVLSGGGMKWFWKHVRGWCQPGEEML